MRGLGNLEFLYCFHFLVLWIQDCLVFALMKGYYGKNMKKHHNNSNSFVKIYFRSS